MATVRVARRVALIAAAMTMLAGTLSLLMVVEGADPQQLVTNLPRAPTVLGFEQYAGYITVNETNERALFYWFFTADHPNASSLPLAIWLNGGPGCSSVGYGSLQELGPFRFRVSETNVSTMYLFNQTWIKEANILFLETPVAVGFSYSNTSSDYSNSTAGSSGVFSDSVTAEDNLQFLLKWFEKFPEYKANEFYLIGESYAGHYVPTFAREIVNYNDAQDSKGTQINFVGYAIGNPYTDAYLNNMGAADWWHSHDLISDDIYAAIIENCNFGADQALDYGDTNPVCANATIVAYDILYIDPYNIYGPYCNDIPVNNTGSTIRRKALKRMLDFVEADSSTNSSTDSSTYNPACALDPIPPYLNSPEVQRALHVDRPVFWGYCSDAVIANYSVAEYLESMLPVHQELISRGLRVWIYSGDIDGVCPTTTARYAIRKLDLDVLTPWYPWQYDTQVGGFTEIYKGLTYVTVRDAGHTVPQSQPGRGLSVFKHFLAGTPLPPFP